MANKFLHDAKRNKKDEFYTRLADIENELRHYRNFFRSKRVLCNCDDPYESNFFKYFALNFNSLDLKCLMATCYDGSPIAGDELLIPFPDNDNAPDNMPKRTAYRIIINEVPDANGDGATDLTDVDLLIKTDGNVLTRLNGNGDFRSDECIELLRLADVVVTNPPFSLFREYLAMLVQFDKKFISVGNQNAITYKEVFPLLKNNQMWLGIHSGDMAFSVPKEYEPKATRYWQDETGQKWRSMGNICWFTNIDHTKRHEFLDLYQQYSPEKYPKYDNYDAINIDKTVDIPIDYTGVMGVPITFLDKYNPEQFELIGATESEGKGFSAGLWNQDSGIAQPLIAGQRKYKRIFIRHKHQ